MRSQEYHRLKRISKYMRGHHDSVYVPHGAKTEYKWLLERSVVNYLPLVVSVISENLHVDGYLSMNPEGEPGKPASPWSIFIANRLVSKQHGLHRAVAKYGLAYTVVLPGTNPVTKASQPVIRPVSPRKITALYDDDVDDEWPAYAVEERLTKTVNGNVRVVRLYDDTNRYTLVGKPESPTLYWPSDFGFGDGGGSGGNDDMGVMGGSDAPPIPISDPEVEYHGLGVCPVVRFLHEIDLDGEMDVSGECEPLIPIQDQVNTTIFNGLMAQQYAAFRQRWVTGMVPEDEEGRPKEPFRMGVDRLLVAEDTDTKFGEFGQTELAPYLAACEMSVRHMSTIAQVPPYHLLGMVANLPLALDTLVAMPGSMRQIGDLKPGDDVLAPDGSPVKVLALSPVFTDHDCYRLRFDDGTEVVADAAHRWATTHFLNPQNPYGHAANLVCPECGWMPQEGKPLANRARGVQVHRSHAHGVRRGSRSGGSRETSVVTTAEVAASLKTSMGTFNHYIPVAKPWDGPEHHYIIDPYVLGVFLGDGDRVHGSITAHTDDAEETAENLRACGEIVDVMPYADGTHRAYIKIRHDWERCPFGHRRERGTRTDTARCHECRRRRDRHEAAPERVNASFQWRMRSLGLSGNKHIPEEYFAGSLKQRLALVQGFMDTDGSVNRSQGSAVITLHDERLARELHRMVCSLGHKAVLRRSKWTSKQMGISGTCWRMSWSAPDPVFRLTRKRVLQRTEFGNGDGKSNSPFRRYITACDPVPRVPVRCIIVDSPQHQFLITNSFIGTCNSADALAAARDGLDRKIEELQGVLSEPWKQTLQLASKAAGDDAGWTDTTSTIMWRDTSARAFAATVDALGKAAQMLGIPATELWRRIPGTTAEEVERWKAVALEKGGLADLNQIVEFAMTKGAQTTGPPHEGEPFQGPSMLRPTGV
jgi:hypothetical protein